MCASQPKFTSVKKMADFQAAVKRVCEVFNVASLYPEQEECLKAICDGKNVHASLPTGYGKSLIFYAIPIIADVMFDRPRGTSKVIVISPLKTLMEDQVRYLKSMSLSAVALHDEQSEEILQNVESGAFTYVFLSPERMLNSSRWRKLLSSVHYRTFLASVEDLKWNSHVDYIIKKACKKLYSLEFSAEPG